MKQNIVPRIMLVLLVWNAVVSWQNNAIISQLHNLKQAQLNANERKIKRYQDSLFYELKLKEKKVKALEKELMRRLKYSAKNNIKYENKKNNALAVTDADSLAMLLSDRYR